MIKKIAVLTSGGDAPGMNAAIRSVVRSSMSYGIKVFGVRDGYLGLIHDDIFELGPDDVSGIIVQGGTILGSARVPGFKEAAVRELALENLKKHEIDALVVIGGDGSYRGALSLAKSGIAVATIPGTIDNDIPGTEQTIGFDTALNTAIEAIDKLRDTSTSHHRCSVVEVMGNHCGDIALYSGIATGAELVITPETGFDFKETIQHLRELDEVRKKKHAVVVISEKLTDVEDLAVHISAQTSFSGRSTVLGYVQRGGSPTAMDRILATQMGDSAVKSLVEGNKDHAVGWIDGKISSMPIEAAFEYKRSRKDDLFDLQKRLV
ncbi:MAG: 6-phosphofructokinase [Erysipelothrix sp.]|nr:6-phosphofructokinase [Erysipelothrix sp.]